MIVTDGEKVMTLQELARKMCHDLIERNDEACWDGSCPAQDYCALKNNGMVRWLKKVATGEQD